MKSKFRKLVQNGIIGATPWIFLLIIILLIEPGYIYPYNQNLVAPILLAGAVGGIIGEKKYKSHWGALLCGGIAGIGAVLLFFIFAVWVTLMVFR